MRPIKFRAWLRKEKTMLNVIRLNIGFGRYEIQDEPEKGVLVGTECVNIDIMQFTGLKDKKGKEIYEDDIVGCPQRKYQVKYDDRTGQWYGEQASGDSNYISWNKFEVIGNIYENPTLLKEI